MKKLFLLMVTGLLSIVSSNNKEQDYKVLTSNFATASGHNEITEKFNSSIKHITKPEKIPYQPSVSLKDYQDYISRKFSWDMIFK